MSTRRHAPAGARNRAPIADVLRDELPKSGTVLEVASGTGEHIAYFAEQFPDLAWWPSERDPDALSWISAQTAAAASIRVMPPKLLDAASNDWPVGHCDAILCINMVHISPWAATLGLMRGAGYYLDPGAPLILYGPYRRAGVATVPSNEAFDASLKARNPEWGLRTVEQVAAVAEANGLALHRLVEMPANNLTLVFRKR